MAEKIDIKVSAFQYLVDPYLKWFFERYKDVQEVSINGEKYLTFPHGEVCSKEDYIISIGSYMIPTKEDIINNESNN